MFTKNYDNFDADFYFDKITDITPYIVRKMGVKALAIDLDNTMLPYGGYHIEDSAKEWAEIMKKSGIPLIIVSNTVLSRAFILSKQLDSLPFVAPAFKPGTFCLKLAAKKLGIPVSEIAMIGDKSSTDIVSANRIGAVSVKVKPIKEKSENKVALPKPATVAAMLASIR
jgi:uncharacterized protein